MQYTKLSKCSSTLERGNLQKCPSNQASSRKGVTIFLDGNGFPIRPIISVYIFALAKLVYLYDENGFTLWLKKIKFLSCLSLLVQSQCGILAHA
ncbi:hypothetical protein A9Q98_10620 [Thalassotalea sp. 42_200_T64]|nr:hypothetical protein A9Q98_10620 [Thalassotalea sp. 42_200_T64]